MNKPYCVLSVIALFPPVNPFPLVSQSQYNKLSQAVLLSSYIRIHTFICAGNSASF